MASSDEADPRRRLLTILVAGGSAGMGLAATVPALTLLAHPLRRKTITSSDEAVLVQVAPSDIRIGRPVRVDVVADRRDGWSRLEKVKLGAAFLIRSPAGPLRAFSAACPHLGCGIDWDPQAERFDCPCHKSGFGTDGRCLFGPAPRDLDELDLVVTDAEVRIRYRRFKVASKLKEPIG